MPKLDAPLRMASADSLAEFVERHPRLFVLTGAGCSTDSGIPDYRDAAGEWKRRPPIMFQAFVTDERARKRYWARSLVGFRRMRSARPNDAHTSLAALERRGRIVQLVTQNVDGLHHAAGSQHVIDLHGRIDYGALPGLRAPQFSRAAATGARATESGLRLSRCSRGA
jgi:NAD-dependent SIR2 family protein deacetylase